jgi:hypothetical protein
MFEGWIAEQLMTMLNHNAHHCCPHPITLDSVSEHFHNALH